MPTGKPSNENRSYRYIMSQIILASSSPYRKQLLERLRLPFSIHSPDIDETPLPNESPVALAQRLAIEKAQVIAQQHPGHLVIGSDQVATHQGQPLGKAGNFDNAYAQLRQVSGQAVEFHTALCVTNGQHSQHANVVTQCKFRTLSAAEITAYLHQEKPWDTAGSAKAESLGIALMEHIRSDDPTAIIGLPLIALSRILRAFGVNPLLAAGATHDET